jgi:uncharacterized protein YbcV (DUF1398 family)
MAMKLEAQSLIESTHQACRVDKTLNFPQAIMRLAEAGIESYHTDYRREETTYYLPTGESHVVCDTIHHESVADPFDPEAVIAAVRYAQADPPDYTYEKFVGLTCRAGCVGYFVWLAGQKAQYFGRQGEIHVEHFPGSK